VRGRAAPGRRRLPVLPRRLRRPRAHPHLHVQRGALRGARGVQRRPRPGRRRRRRR
jgi:hypothetical protein